jgi:hypothetical protein
MCQLRETGGTADGKCATETALVEQHIEVFLDETFATPNRRCTIRSPIRSEVNAPGVHNFRMSIALRRSGAAAACIGDRRGRRRENPVCGMCVAECRMSRRRVRAAAGAPRLDLSVKVCGACRKTCMTIRGEQQ